MFTVVALLVAGFAYADEKSQAPAKGEKKASTTECECRTGEVARKATWLERRAYSRNLFVVEPVKFVKENKVEAKAAASSCECCDTSVLATTRRAARRVRGAFDGLLCR